MRRTSSTASRRRSAISARFSMHWVVCISTLQHYKVSPTRSFRAAHSDCRRRRFASYWCPQPSREIGKRALSFYALSMVMTFDFSSADLVSTASSRALSLLLYVVSLRSFQRIDACGITGPGQDLLRSWIEQMAQEVDKIDELSRRMTDDRLLCIHTEQFVRLTSADNQNYYTTLMVICARAGPVDTL